MGGHIWTQSQAALDELLARIEPVLAEVIVDRVVAHGELTLTLQGEAIVRALTFLRDEPSLLFKELVDLCGVDYPPRERRFEVVYHLLSLRHNQRIRIKVETDEATPVPSVMSVFPTADWFEREAWDMYGIVYDGHPDLRRIYMWEGFEGFPQRKDFPLRGYKDELNPFGAEGPPPTRPDLATRNIP